MPSDDFYAVSAVPFGYVGIREYSQFAGSHDALVLAFTTDFHNWHESAAGAAVTSCPGWDPHWDTFPQALIRSDDKAVLMAMEVDPARTVCDPESGREFHSPVAWISTDGISWTRTALDWPFGYDYTEGGKVVGGWWVDGAFELIVQSLWAPDTLIVRSADAISWQEIARLSNDQGSDPRLVSALSGDGTRAIAMTSEDVTNDRTTLSLLVSADGDSWSELETPFTGVRNEGRDGSDWLGRVYPPRSPVNAWTVLLEHEDCFETDRRATVWRSPDLTNWSSADFPWIVPRTTNVFSTRYGLIARGGEYCDVTGGPGPMTPEGDQLLISRDAVTWESLRPRRLRDLEINIVDGPAGIFLIDSSGGVWSTGQE